MTTVINNPGDGGQGGSMGMILGLILLVVVGFLVFSYGLPALRQLSAPSVNVPGKIDVNINQPNK